MEKQLLKLTPLTESSFYILLAFKEPNHGYGVIKQVEHMSNGRLVIAAGTLYGVISSFLKHGLIKLIEQSGGRSKKTYVITDEGYELLSHEVKRLKELVQNGMEVLK